MDNRDPDRRRSSPPAALFLVVFELVRRRRLLERYALLWLFAAAVLLGLSIWRGALEQLAVARSASPTRRRRCSSSPSASCWCCCCTSRSVISRAGRPEQGARAARRAAAAARRRARGRRGASADADGSRRADAQPGRRCRAAAPRSRSSSSPTTRAAELRRDARPRCARSCEPGDELVVVDNASRDDSAAVARAARGARVLDAGAQRRLRRRLPSRARAATRGAAAVLPATRTPSSAPGCARRAARRRRRAARLGRLAGARHAARRRAGQHGRQRHPLARDRLGGRAAARRSRPSPARRARSPSPPAPRSSCAARRGTRVGGFDAALLHVRRGPRPRRCGCGSRAGASASCPPRASSTTTTSSRATTSGSTSSATAGGRCSAPTRRRCWSRLRRRCSRSRSRCCVAAARRLAAGEAARPGRRAAHAAGRLRRRRACRPARVVPPGASPRSSPPRWTRPTSGARRRCPGVGGAAGGLLAPCAPGTGLGDARRPRSAVPGLRQTGGRETYARELLPALRALRPDVRLTAFVSREASAPGWWSERRQVGRAPRLLGAIAARWALGEPLLLPLAARRAGSTCCTSWRTSHRCPAFPRVVTVHDVILRRLPDTVTSALLVDQRGDRAACGPHSRPGGQVVGGVARRRVDCWGSPRADRRDPQRRRAAGARGRRAAGRARMRVPPGTPVALCVAAKVAHKNLPALVERDGASNAIRARCSCSRATGPTRAAGRAGARSAPGDDVRCVGAVPQSELEDLYAAASTCSCRRRGTRASGSRCSTRCSAACRSPAPTSRCCGGRRRRGVVLRPGLARGDRRGAARRARRGRGDQPAARARPGTRAALLVGGRGHRHGGVLRARPQRGQQQADVDRADVEADRAAVGRPAPSRSRGASRRHRRTGRAACARRRGIRARPRSAAPHRAGSAASAGRRWRR